MKLKLPATNLTYVILYVKYMLDGEECTCNMHMINDNKMGEVEIDYPTGAIVTNVTMNEVTNAQKIVSIQVLYDASDPVEDEVVTEPKPEGTTLNVSGDVTVNVSGDVDPKTIAKEVRRELRTKPTDSNLKVETKVEAMVEKAKPKKEDDAVTHSE